MQWFQRDGRIYIVESTVHDYHKLKQLGPVGQACFASPHGVDTYVTLPDSQPIRQALGKQVFWK
tara:strand:+ start:6824 stop:7015 length:192 start_codon:yes stop_codon:yes gene_type:complete